MSQPAVSRSLKELEALLGTQLFDRVGRGLALNSAGRIFQVHASTSITELVRGRDRVGNTAIQRRRLSIGTLPTAASDLVPRAAITFHEHTKDAQLHILTGPNWLLFNQLRDGQLDLVVGRMPEKDNMEGLLFEQLYLERIVLVSRPDHPITKLPADALAAQLHHHPLILPPRGAVISDTVTRYLVSIGLPDTRGHVETVALPVGRRIVEESNALWFISSGVVSDEIENGRLMAIDLRSPLLSGPVGISQLQNAPINADRKVFADCLRNVSTS